MYTAVDERHPTAMTKQLTLSLILQSTWYKKRIWVIFIAGYGNGRRLWSLLSSYSVAFIHEMQAKGEQAQDKSNDDEIGDIKADVRGA